MKCVKCGSKTHVLRTDHTVRRRECLSCGHRFSTEEIVCDEPQVQTIPKPEKVKPKVERTAPAKTSPGRKARLFDDDAYTEDNDYLPSTY
jgi:hypothetical protein